MSNENVGIWLFFYGGFVVAFIFLLVATFIRHSNGARVGCFLAAFCGLIYEGGCFTVAAGIGRATGGSDGDLQTIYGYLEAAFFIAFLWFCLVMLFLPVKKNPSQDKQG